MTPLERVRAFFETLPFSLEIILFDESTRTSALAAQALGVEVGQIAKTLVFKVKSKGEEKPQGVIVVTSGDVKVDTKKLKQLTGFKPRFADDDESWRLQGFPRAGYVLSACLKSSPFISTRACTDFR